MAKGPDERGLSRRQLLAAGAVAGAALAAQRAGTTHAARGGWVERRTDFSLRADASGWGGQWRTIGVANLRCAGGVGLLEAGSDVFPNDPRPVAFLPDLRSRETEIEAAVERVGAGAGAVLRRVGARRYYAAIIDAESRALRLVARLDSELIELASAPLAAVPARATLTLRASGSNPTALHAQLSDASGVVAEADASNAAAALQRPGDPGVLATARTLFPSDANPVLPALGNLHLLPYSVQEGQAVIGTPLGQAVIDEIRRESTAGFSSITVRTPPRPRRTRPSVVAAFTGPPVLGGARLNVAADMAARVDFEVSTSPRMRNARVIAGARTNSFGAASRLVRGLPAGERIYWRPRLTRHGQVGKGQIRSFRNGPGDEPFRVAVAACASQFGPCFDLLERAQPDVFVWQGDLNYPDTHGPLAQTVSGYAGIWRDFLANPRIAPILRSASFAPQRDDHDYGVQDANATNIPDYPWALEPWEALMSRRVFYRFPAGPAEVWVLDQRRFKSDPESTDAAAKTLLGERQRRWLLRTLSASRAPFKIICSPCTVFMPANARDGNWAVGYETERDALLAHVRDRVGGSTIFLTGDTHLTGVYETGRDVEVRAAPVGIPKPNDITLVDPLAAQNLAARDGVTYAGDECHLTVLELRMGKRPSLDLRLLREDGTVPYARTFEAG